jgi:hypothetical protein
MPVTKRTSSTRAKSRKTGGALLRQRTVEIGRVDIRKLAGLYRRIAASGGASLARDVVAEAVVAQAVAAATRRKSEIVLAVRRMAQLG